MDNESKREISPIIRNILALDVALSEAFVKSVEKLSFLRQLKTHYQALEISCHGLPWFVSVLVLIWVLNSNRLYQMQVNLLMGLTLDVIIIAILKAVTRRRRPASAPMSIGPDKFSFPSGHASRAMLIFYFFKYLWPVSTIYLMPLSAWVFCVAMSRLLMRRHHILDICVGLLVGILEGMVLGILYLDAETCKSLVYWITDEKLDGAEYDL